MEGGLSHMLVVMVPHDGSADSPVDDGFTSDGDGMGHGDRLDHVERCGHLNNLFDVFDDIIGHIVWLVNIGGLVDGMDLPLHADHGGGVADGSSQSSGHGNLEIRNGGLQDLSGVARDKRSLAKMNLFGDDGFRFVDGGDISCFLMSHMRSGQRDGGGDMADHGGSMVQERGVDGVGQWGCGHDSGCGCSVSAGKQGRQNEQGVHG